MYVVRSVHCESYVQIIHFCVKCYIGGSSIATWLPGLTLLEISVESIEDYKRSWTCYELIAVANKWETGKVLAVLPALLRGKLLDFYTALEDSEKGGLITLKQALAERAGLTKSPFIAAKLFGERRQEVRESIRDFELALRKLFAQAYPGVDANTSVILLGCFITGLRPEITRQILLAGTPDKLDNAVQHAIRIERTLTIEEQHVHILQFAAEGKDSLRETLEKVITRLEALELRLHDPKPSTMQTTRYYHCQEEGHFRCNCPLRGKREDRTAQRKSVTVTVHP